MPMTDPAPQPKQKRRPRSLVPAGPSQLPLWSDKARGAPNSLARSALFTCADKRKPRRTYEREVIVSLAGQEVRYTGKELRQDDLTVWLQVVHLARMQPLGDQVEVSAHALGTAIGWGEGGDTYKRLRDSIARMREGTVWVDKPDGKGFSGNLIMRLEWSDAGSKSKEKWKLYLDPNILQLFQPDSFTLLNGEERLNLTPLAQWLYVFYMTHANPFPFKIENLYALCGSTSAELAGFTRNLVKALEQLKARGLISDFVHDKRSRTIHVIRRKALTAERSQPDSNRDSMMPG